MPHIENIGAGLNIVYEITALTDNLTWACQKFFLVIVCMYTIAFDVDIEIHINGKEIFYRIKIFRFTISFDFDIESYINRKEIFYRIKYRKDF